MNNRIYHAISNLDKNNKLDNTNKHDKRIADSIKKLFKHFPKKLKIKYLVRLIIDTSDSNTYIYYISSSMNMVEDSNSYAYVVRYITNKSELLSAQ